jgi:EAL domain-containing protein (putative c-di-GMP-specific phosphodiesterase class I)
MTFRVVQAALRQCRAWHEAGRTVRTAVNLSARSLQGDQLIETIARLVRAWAVSSAWLAVEITETTLMADPGRAMTVLSSLHDMGVSICVDDFGTGYSSLAYLKRLPIDEIKIDRSFVKDMTVNDNDAVIVRSVVDLGHNLGLQVTAEGVEDRGTWDMLAAMGCDTIQGYYLSPPLPADRLLSWLSERPASLLA